MKRKILTMTAAQTRIDDKNMKATADTTYSSEPIPLSGFQAMRVVATVDNTGGGSTGTAKVQWQRLDETGAALGAAIDLMTAINTKTDTVAIFRVHHGVAASSVNGTVGTSADDIYPLGTGKLVLYVTEASDATTCTADVTLYAEG